MVALELAAHRAQADGQEQRVRVRCDPYALLSALGTGRLPADLVPGDYEVLVPAG